MSGETEIAVLQENVRNLTDAVKELTLCVRKNNEKLERLNALEMQHNNTNDKIATLTGQIKSIETEVATHVERDRTEHQFFQRAIWAATGFCAACSLLWTVVGYRMNSLIDESIKAAYEMRLHIAEDKIKTRDDVITVTPRP